MRVESSDTDGEGLQLVAVDIPVWSLKYRNTEIQVY